ncbi:MAG: dethiobiotin synthase [Candidatus Aureabacteria bacterium]|nr:dethiobiotin synthase [Candidatus Auribacterota bacterium]MCK5162020.1 dethiobiotin synthase [Candidatus Auribacterota bacterium]MCK5654754.1 dethiobiotin synthase [Candidatus Auribacterota bacterium]
MNVSPIFITATGTGVGKTVVSSVILALARKRGHNPVIMKPIETDTDGECSKDISFCYTAAGMKNRAELKETAPFLFKLGASPHLAGREEGVVIDREKIIDSYNNLKNKFSPVIVEGAGGLLVPITENYLYADLIKDMAIEIIIVSNIELGTINHTLLTVECAKKRGMGIKGIIFNNVPEILTDIHRDNMRIIPLLSGVKVLGVIPHIHGLNTGKELPGDFGEVVSSISLEKLL